MRTISSVLLLLYLLFLLLVLELCEVNGKMYLDTSRTEDEAVDLIDLYSSSSNPT